MIHVNEDTLQDLNNQLVQGNLPLLIRVKNPGIYWSEEEKAEYKQVDGYVNLVSAPIKLKYKEVYWLPCVFSFTPPLKDGSKQGTASVSIMAIDARITSLLQVIDLTSEIEVIAAYAKEEIVSSDATKTYYKFVELNNYKMYINSASVTGTTASFSLSYKDNLTQNIPYDMAIPLRVPGGVK